jgi:hypothetical protein
MGKHSAPETEEEALEEFRAMNNARTQFETAADDESTHCLFTCAWVLLQTAPDVPIEISKWANHPYAQGIFDLMADFIGADRSIMPSLLRLSTKLDAEELGILLRLLLDGRH